MLYHGVEIVYFSSHPLVQLYCGYVYHNGKKMECRHEHKTVKKAYSCALQKRRNYVKTLNETGGAKDE